MSMHSHTQSELFSSADFYLSAYLISQGVALHGHTRRNGMTNFTFQNTDKLQLLIEAYYSLKAVVNPVQYGNAIRNLKTIIHTDNTLSNQNTHYVEQFRTQNK